jgi:hypothetical protein
LCFPWCSWDDRCVPPHPAFYWWNEFLLTFLPGLVLSLSPLGLCLLNSLNYRHEPCFLASAWIY